ncbi:MAG TPA: hypothetical protein VL360_00545 [Gammaproteobacteria bacterium]|jgi:hypothetical protein|nr:hypothetical protein [Gammaproteobacteria bacterium]
MMRYFVAIIIMIAVVVGILALKLHRDQLVTLIIFRDFFDVTLPILGFGALIKYLCTNSCRCCCDKHK